MPPIVHDYPAIKKSLLGDSWWQPTKPKPEAPKPEPAFFTTYTQELVDAVQNSRKNSGGISTALRIARLKHARSRVSGPTVATTPFPPSFYTR